MYCGSTGYKKLKEFLIYRTHFPPRWGKMSRPYRRFFDLLSDLHFKEETDTLNTIYFLKEEWHAMITVYRSTSSLKDRTVICFSFNFGKAEQM